jgi:hypothetical protein
MFEIIAIIAVLLAIAIAIVLILAATKPDTSRQQFSPMDELVPVGKQGPRDEAHL